MRVRRRAGGVEHARRRVRAVRVHQKPGERHTGQPGGGRAVRPRGPPRTRGRRRAPLRVASARRARGETRGGSVRGRGRRRRRRRMPARRRRLRRPG